MGRIIPFPHRPAPPPATEDPCEAVLDEIAKTIRYAADPRRPAATRLDFAKIASHFFHLARERGYFGPTEGAP